MNTKILKKAWPIHAIQNSNSDPLHTLHTTHPRIMSRDARVPAEKSHIRASISRLVDLINSRHAHYTARPYFPDEIFHFSRAQNDSLWQFYISRSLSLSLSRNRFPVLSPRKNRVSIYKKRRGEREGFLFAMFGNWLRGAAQVLFFARGRESTGRAIFCPMKRNCACSRFVNKSIDRGWLEGVQALDLRLISFYCWNSAKFQSKYL